MKNQFQTRNILEHTNFKILLSQRNKKMAAQRSVFFDYYLTTKLSRTVVNFDID